MFLIFGSGRVAREIAKKLDDYLLIVEDRSLAEKLEREGFKAVWVDPEDLINLPLNLPLKDSTVILASNLSRNLKIAEIVKGIARDVIAVGEKPEACSIYSEMGISKVCGTAIAATVLSEVSELKRRYVEVKIDRYNEGQNLKDLDLGDFCTILSVIRDGKLMKPHPELRLKKGDILGVLCGREVRYTKHPFEEVFVVLTEEKNSEKLLKEVELFKSKFQSHVLFMHKIGDTLACTTAEPENPNPVGLDEAIRIVKEFRVKPDLIISDVGKKDDSLLEETTSIAPLLIAKGKNAYEKILTIVNTADPYDLLNAAVSLGISCKCKILFLDVSQLSLLSKFTETPGLEIKVSKGNQVIDAVKEARSDYDLILVSWKNDVGNIDFGILKKIIFDTQASVIVV
ncbi:MAG: NAD-binding protein [Archaeoglobus sp.]|nr:NAD-binding protein [Archaeoglobus sp.]